jgi:hypothetical protein
MAAGGCEEVALEAEVTNSGALRLYQKLGFIRDKRLHRYYLSGSDAYRLKLLLPARSEEVQQELEAAEQLRQLGLGDGQQQGRGLEAQDTQTQPDDARQHRIA